MVLLQKNQKTSSTVMKYVQCKFTGSAKIFLAAEPKFLSLLNLADNSTLFISLKFPYSVSKASEVQKSA